MVVFALLSLLVESSSGVLVSCGSNFRFNMTERLLGLGESRLPRPQDYTAQLLSGTVWDNRGWSPLGTGAVSVMDSSG